jgi:hypothetical protein
MATLITILVGFLIGLLVPTPGELLYRWCKRREERKKAMAHMKEAIRARGGE